MASDWDSRDHHTFPHQAPPLDFDLRQLTYAWVLSEELHFGRAAERLGMEQSPLSKAITTLEESIGVRLFDRTRRSTTITPLGKQLLPQIKNVVVDAYGLRFVIGRLVKEKSGILRIGIGSEICSPRVVQLIREARLDDPLIEIVAEHNKNGFIEDRLRYHELDIAILQTSSDPLVPPFDKCTVVVLSQEPMALIMPENHPLASQRVLKSLQGAGNLFFCLWSHIPPISQLCPIKDAIPEPYRFERVTTCEQVITMVNAGLGLGILGLSQVESRKLSGVVSLVIDIPKIMLTTYVLRVPPEWAETDVTEILASRFMELALRVAKSPD